MFNCILDCNHKTTSKTRCRSNCACDCCCLVLQISVWIKPKLRRVSRRLQSTPRRWDINHSNSPLGWPTPIRNVFFLPQSSQTSYWFSMPWSIPGRDATWSVSALQESVPKLWCVLICSQYPSRVKLCVCYANPLRTFHFLLRFSY